MPKSHLRTVIALLLLLALSAGCNLGTSGSASDSASGDAAPKETKSVQLDSGGGSFTVGGDTVAIGANSLSSPANLTIETYAPPPLEAGTAADQSDVLSVSGIPAGFQGEVRVTMAIPDSIRKAMDADGSAGAGKLTLKMAEPAYSPSDGGIAYLELPVDAQVDAAAGTATVVLPVDYRMARRGGGMLAAPAAQAGFGLHTDNNFYFRMYYDESDDVAKADSDYFTISHPADMDSQTLARLVDALEQNKNRIGEMGFLFDPFGPAKKFRVFVENCDHKSGKFGLYGELIPCDGSFRTPWYDSSAEATYLVVNPRLLGEGEKFTATVGHELMHAFQFLSHVEQYRRTFDEFVMLDEAVAMWYESVAVGDDAYVPNFALDNDDFFTKNWFFTHGNEYAQDLGYGASWFIRYLANTYGEEVIYKAYEGKYAIGEIALGTAVVDNTPTILGETFREFLPAYLLHTDEISTGLAPEEKFQRMLNKQVEMRSDEGNPDQLTFYSAKLKITPTAGTVTPDSTLDPEPSFSMTQSLAGMNGSLFFFQINSDNEALETAGTVTVQVDTSQPRSGVMVFGIPVVGDYASAEDLTYDVEFLSSDGTSTLTVSDFSSPAGGAQFTQLAFILFNMNDNEDGGASTITLTVTYGSAKAADVGVILYAKQWLYPEGVCDLKSSSGSSSCEITANTNMPSCMGSLTGGGGGGGEGASSEPLPACMPKPDWCWQCGEILGGWTFTDTWRTFGDQAATYLTFHLDESGDLTGISSSFSPFTSLEPTSFWLSGGNVHAEWRNLPDYYDNVGYLTLDGTLSASGGSGTWVMGHPGPGDTIKGTWIAASCMDASIQYGYSCE
jgi:hypothetical protein